MSFAAWLAHSEPVVVRLPGPVDRAMLRWAALNQKMDGWPVAASALEPGDVQEECGRVELTETTVRAVAVARRLPRRFGWKYARELGSPGWLVRRALGMLPGVECAEDGNGGKLWRRV